MSKEQRPYQPIKPEKFKETTLVGVGWSTFSQFYKQGIQIVVGIILARLLTPEAFGLIGMVTVLTGFAKVFKDMGLGAALIHKPDVKTIHFNTVFWANLCFGLTLTGVFSLIAPFVATFYNEPQLIPITILLSFNFFIDSFGIVHNSIINKELNFKSLSIIEGAYVTTAGIIAITMAGTGFGVWSLVAYTLISAFANVLTLWIISKWRPKMIFSWSALRDLWEFSINLLGFNSLNYWFRNSDDLLVGKFFGSTSLGIYNRAYALMLFPLSNISATISRVMFPAFSSIQDQPERIGQIYLKITQTIALITFPMMMGLIVVAEDFVIAVFGNQWAAMIPILRLFAFVGMLHSINSLNGDIYQALGKTRLQLKVGGTIAVLGVVAIVIGLTGGVYGVALAFTIFTGLSFYPSIRIAVSQIHLSFYEVVFNLKEIFLISLTMSVAVYSIEYFVPDFPKFWPILIVQAGAGIGIYVLLNLLFKPKAYKDILRIFNEMKNRDKL